MSPCISIANHGRKATPNLKKAQHDALVQDISRNSGDIAHEIQDNITFYYKTIQGTKNTSNRNDRKT